MVQILLPPLTGPGPLIVQPLLTGNATWDWALQQFLDPDPSTALAGVQEAMRKQLLPAGGLAFFPCLNLNHPLSPGLAGSGSLVGLNPDHDRCDILRAVALGLCCELKRICGPLQAPRWILTGGAARGSFFQTLLAALLAPAEVFLAEDQEWIGCRGAVHALEQQMPGPALQRIPLPPESAREKIVAAWQRHQKLYETLYAQQPITAPLQITSQAGAFT